CNNQGNLCHEAHSPGTQVVVALRLLNCIKCREHRNSRTQHIYRVCCRHCFDQGQHRLRKLLDLLQAGHKILKLLSCGKMVMQEKIRHLFKTCVCNKIFNAIPSIAECSLFSVDMGDRACVKGDASQPAINRGGGLLDFDFTFLFLPRWLLLLGGSPGLDEICCMSVFSSI